MRNQTTGSEQASSRAPRRQRLAPGVCRLLGPLLVLLFEGCGAARETAEPLRLIEQLQKARVSWPAGGGGEPRLGFELDLPVIGAAGSGRLARVAVGGPPPGGDPTLRPWGRDDRAAILAPSDSVYRFPLTPPAGAELQIGLGYLGGAAGEPPPRVRFEIAVEEGEESFLLLEEELEVAAGGAGWRDRVLPLGRWAGRPVTLRLATPAVRDPAPGGGPLPETLWAAWSTPEVRPAPDRRSEDGAWDLLLISLDTLRADHLGCYGYERPTSPHLDALAARSVRFATAVTQSPWTRPAHRALFNGLYPLSHGGLASPSLAEMLWRAGYATAAWTGGGQINPRFGFHRGFESYRVADWVRDIPAVVAAWERNAGRRQFLFLHTYEIHDPFTHTELAEGMSRGRLGDSFSNRDYRERLGKRVNRVEQEYVRALYDGGIAFTDRQVGRLLDELERRGALERTLIVVTSDHGEQFWEHGNFRHGQNLFDHQLLVPLIVYLPPALEHRLGDGLAGRVIEPQVRLVDLYPTLLDLLGVPVGHAVHGRSLRPLLEGRALPPIDAFAESTNVRTERKGLRSPAFKLVQEWRDGPAGAPQLYDLRADPAESVDVAERFPELVEVLRQRLLAIAGAAGAAPDEELPADLDPELRRELEALGYLGN